jgi:ABC-type polysaccharide/polyol phosphate transport system ATPase subunit
MTPTERKADPPVIVVEQVSKRFVRTEHRPSLRHEALSLFKKMLRRSVMFQNQPFYALQDVSFSVQGGESVGIVGRNGSGKTTLLRLLAGIARPTTGHVEIRGRYAALIGLSAGFLPDLSGRKNIYLNAAIHGLAPRETDKIIDQIIDFAEIRPFIDTPIKHYSSGMAARLGFSIVVHILPDIVLLDEVLAVGDAVFQEKCVERMLKLKAEGRTLLFVSHSAASVEMLCERVIWLHDGHLMTDGPAHEVLEQYQEATHAGLPPT